MERKEILTQEQLNKFEKDGFLIVPSFFSEDELGPVKDSINSMVEELATELFIGGKITKKYEEEGFYTRLTKIEQEFKGAAVLLHKVYCFPLHFREEFYHNQSRIYGRIPDYLI